MVNETRLRTENATAEELKRMPAGTKVTIHGFDRNGVHQMRPGVLVKGTKCTLIQVDAADGFDYLPIRKESDRKWYSVRWIYAEEKEGRTE